MTRTARADGGPPRIVVANKSDLPRASRPTSRRIGTGGRSRRRSSRCLQRPARASTICVRAIVCAAHRRANRCATRRRFQHAPHRAARAGARESCRRRGGGVGRPGRRRSSCSPTCRPRAPGSTRSSARARATTCCSTSSSGSVSGNEPTFRRHRHRRGPRGVEAAYAAARLGCSVGLCTLSRDTVAHMPCNPAVGGTAKGHLVREIDALGGLMGAGDRRHGHPVQAAQSKPRSGRVVAAGAGRQAPLRRMGDGRARARAEYLVAPRPGGDASTSRTAASAASSWKTASATRATRWSSRPARF